MNFLFTKSSKSTSNRRDILTKVSRSGCELFVHHFETVGWIDVQLLT